MFKKIASKAIITLTGVGTLLLPFVLSNCGSAAVYPKAKMEAAFNSVEKYLSDNAISVAAGDVNFSSLPKSNYDTALAYFNTNYTIELFYHSIIFYCFYVSLYPFSSAERLERYNNFYIEHDVTKVEKFSFGSTANSFEINITYVHSRGVQNGKTIKARESIYCLTRLENNKLYEKSVFSTYTTNDNKQVSRVEHDTEITKNNDKFFYINHTPEEYRTDEKDGLDIIFNYIPLYSGSYTPFPEISTRGLGIGTVTENDSSGRYYVYLSPFD
jgi:hypothetical protein